jgi:CRISPR-associated endonuclease Csn1
LQVAITNPDRIVEKDLREKIKSLLAENLNEKQIRTYFKVHQDVWHEVDLNWIAVLYYTNETPDRYFAKREKLGSSFNAASIDKITDSGIREILRRHLALCSNKPEEAFSPEGIERMNQNILALNNGKPHKPIYSVRKYESSNKKFTIGQTGVKTRQYVEAADGTCLYFAIYRHIVNGEEKRYCYTIPLQVVMEYQQKNGKKWKNELDLWIRANHHIENATELYAMLSPGDLVYMPTREEVATGVLSWNKNNIYKVVSFKEAYCYFVPHYLASPLINKCEYTTDNKTPREGLIRPTDRMIKDYCIPLKINRLGEITIV